MRKIAGKPWFGPRQWIGWGSAPATWQGWLVTVVIVAALLGTRALIEGRLLWLPVAVVSIVAYYVVIRLTGVRPDRPGPGPRERR